MINNLPAFGFSVPVNQTPAAVVAQPTGFVPPDDLMGLATCDDFDQGKQKLPIGEYNVVVTKMLRPKTRKHGTPVIAEYTVEESSNPDITLGHLASYFRKTDSESLPYLSIWLGQTLGARTKEERLQVKSLLPFIVMSEVSCQPVPVVDVITRQPVMGANGEQLVMQPGTIVGHRYHVSVFPGKEKDGKRFTDETWTRLA
jgi:hypothetical protein